LNGLRINVKTTLDIPEDLLRAVTEIVGVKTKSEAVRIALNDYVRSRRREQLLALRGKLMVADVTRDLAHAEIGGTRRPRRHHDKTT
jgi:Arc/MetJ family transcription regulator